MSLLVETWEKRLLAQAYAPLENFLRQEAEILMDQAQRQRAYVRCEAITREHSRTFSIASSLLPSNQQQAMHALYAFCRVSDDLVDRNPHDKAKMLSDWRTRSLIGTPPEDDLVAWAWVDTRTRHHIPRQYAEQLLDGIATDLTITRYDTFDDLAHYCYAVASTVGLMVMHIVGYAGKEAIPYAVKLGVALQMTNILRDVGEDWRNGRLYLPQDELAAFGLSEADIAQGAVDSRWRDFMRFQIDRTRRLYAEALPGVGLLGQRGRFAVGAASELYQAILKDIEAHDYDVFTRRAHTRDLQKLSMMPGIWWRSRSGKYPAHRVAQV
ncbi:MAG: squalene/phytoene synthase family protein [Candidatus Promineofilum sp.]|nr:squalene/phytoene synthase family protein [Promineifilum sp.]